MKETDRSTSNKKPGKFKSDPQWAAALALLPCEEPSSEADSAVLGSEGSVAPKIEKDIYHMQGLRVMLTTKLTKKTFTPSSLVVP